MKELWQTLKMVHRCDPASFRRRIVCVFLQSVLPLINLYLLKMLVDSITEAVGGGDNTQWMPLLVAFAVVFLLNRVVSALDNLNNDVLSQRLIDYMSDLMQRQAARLDMAYYDTPAYHDTLHRAQQEAGTRPVLVLNNFMALIGAVISIVGVLTLLITASAWVVAVMLVAVMPSFLVRLRKARAIYSFRRENTALYRRTAYYGYLLTSRDAAKEMRVFQLAPHFRRLFVEVRARLVERLIHISRNIAAADILCGVVEAVALLLVVWLLATKAFNGAITLGSFVMLFEAFRRGQGYLSSLVASVAGLYDNRLFVGNLFEFLRLQPSLQTSGQPESWPAKIEYIEFRDVTFRYPDTNQDVLCHYNLTARVGEVTRIEGRNGYGKSTLVKLLLRLYDPQDGAVLINGIDIRRFDLQQLRSGIGVLFQDFVRYNCTAAENIAFGDIASVASTDGTTRASRLAGADTIIDHLPQGGDTQLGRMFEGGQELSMGQWQRIALARALQSDAPVLILDEPMAWLDTDARQHLNESMEILKQDKIIIMITHA